MSVALVWFRQDLRSIDNPALTAACNNHSVVIPLYILDHEITPLGDAQKWWLHHSLLSLEKNLSTLGIHLVLRQGNALSHLSDLICKYKVDTVYWNRCYEPSVIQRDKTIKIALQKQGVSVLSSNGSLLNEPWNIKNKSGGYFKVFTPFWRHCLQQITVPAPNLILNHPVSPSVSGDRLAYWQLLPTKPNWASEFEHYWCPGENGAHEKLNNFLKHNLNGYKKLRNEPAKDATSKLSPHLHFGEISPWQILRALEEIKLDKTYDLASAENFLSEIGWREFSYHLLYHFPELPDSNFKSEFDAFSWRFDKSLLKSWQQGMTGYPIVDAGMRELWRTGYMHNRVRMIVASFLTKDLLIDWRIGAAWFWNTLLDADLANNSASWQWVAGSGADAAPYFRIFNPVLQGEKFDANGDYIKRWVPELAHIPTRWIHKPWAAPSSEVGLCLGKDYPHRIVDHAEARNVALTQYQKIKK